MGTHSGLSCPSPLVGCAPSKCAERSAKRARQGTRPARAAAALPIGWAGGGERFSARPALSALRSAHLWPLRTPVSAQPSCFPHNREHVRKSGSGSWTLAADGPFPDRLTPNKLHPFTNPPVKHIITEHLLQAWQASRPFLAGNKTSEVHKYIHLKRNYDC